MTPTVPNRKLAAVRTLLVGLAASASLAAQAGEPAQPSEVVTRVTVGYADLDLAAPDGARTLYSRLRAAAHEACGPAPLVREHREWADYRACYDRALNEAVRKVDSQQLYALHAERTGRSAVG